MTISYADDCAGDSGMAQGPGDGGFAGGAVHAVADIAQALGDERDCAKAAAPENRDFALRQSSSANAATRSRVIAPVSKPEAIGE